METKKHAVPRPHLHLGLWLSLGALLLSGCAGTAGDGSTPCVADAAAAGGDTLCVNVAGVETTVTEVVTGANPYGYDPAVVAFYDTENGSTNLAAVSGYTHFANEFPFDYGVVLGLEGAAATGTFAIGAASENNVSYFSGGDAYEANGGVIGTSGTVTITSISPNLQGTFSVTACLQGSEGADCAVASLNLDGSFDITTDVDNWPQTVTPDFVTFDDGATNQVFTDVTDGGNPLGFSEGAFAYYEGNGQDATNIAGVSGYTDFTLNPPFETLVSVIFPGEPATGQLDTQDEDQLNLAFFDGTGAENGPNFQAHPGLTDSQARMEIWRTFPKIEGVYDGTLCGRDSQTGESDCSTGGSKTVSGHFSVTRESDNWVNTILPEYVTYENVTEEIAEVVNTEEDDADVANPFGKDGLVFGQVRASDNRLTVTSVKEFTSVDDPLPFTEIVTIEIDLNDPVQGNQYDVTDGDYNHSVNYIADGGFSPPYTAGSAEALSSGTINLFKNADVGGRIEGDYNVHACVGDDCRDITGRFSVIREADQAHESEGGSPVFGQSPATVESFPYPGTVGFFRSYYELSTQCGTITVTLSGLSGNVDLYAYTDSEFSVQEEGSPSSNTGTAGETLDVNSSGMIWIAVQNTENFEGATFTLDVTGGTPCM